MTKTKRGTPGFGALSVSALVAGVLGFYLVSQIQARYTFSLQSPVQIRFQSPLVIAHKTISAEAEQAKADRQGRPLTAYQQYACENLAPIAAWR